MGVNEPQYTSEQLEEFKKQNATGVVYGGKHYTLYGASQQQRQVERAIRRQKNHIIAAGSTGDKDKLLTSQIRLTRLNQEYTRFSKAAGLKTQKERATVAGFGRGQAGKARKAVSWVDERFYRLDNVRQKRLRTHKELALPQGECAVVQDDKFTKYIFNPNNPHGNAKGVAFQRCLGYTIDNWKELQAEIRARATLYPARKTGDKGHGMTYEQKIILYGKKGKPANVIISWIEDGGTPRMTSAYIKEVRKNED